MISAALVVASLAMPAHDVWADGSVVPGWVKLACCGPQEAHRLSLSQVYPVPNGWRIQGMDYTVPHARVLPSQDGEVWAFWNANYGQAALIHCLFLPFTQ